MIGEVMNGLDNTQASATTAGLVFSFSAVSTTRGRTDPFSVTLGLGSRQDESIRKRVVETAEKLNTKPAVVALAWVLSKPFITSPIIGASKPHHLTDAVAATELKLDARTIAKLEEPYSSKPVAGHG